MREKQGYVNIKPFLYKLGISKRHHLNIKETITGNALGTSKMGYPLEIELRDPNGLKAINDKDYFDRLDFSRIPQYMPYSIAAIVMGIVLQIGTESDKISKIDNSISKLFWFIIATIGAYYLIHLKWI